MSHNNRCEAVIIDGWHSYRCTRIAKFRRIGRGPKGEEAEVQFCGIHKNLADVGGNIKRYRAPDDGDWGTKYDTVVFRKSDLNKLKEKVHDAARAVKSCRNDVKYAVGRCGPVAIEFVESLMPHIEQLRSDGVLDETQMAWYNSYRKMHDELNHERGRLAEALAAELGATHALGAAKGEKIVS